MTKATENDEGRGATGLVFSIQRFSLQDGPGIRTTVFLKGCPLRCDWCSNPESQSSGIEIMYRQSNCQACGACVQACGIGAISFEGDWPSLDREACTLCLDCVKACPNGALETTGQYMDWKDVVEEAGQDEPFYNNSGGGVTLSGGEPLFQADFACRVLKGCRERGLRTAVDTCGYAPWEDLRRALEYTDLVLFDLKHLDPAKHQQGTRVRNELILDNLKRTAASKSARIWIRIPVIPGYNDSEAFFQELASVLKETPVEKVSLLAYHKWGESKYHALGREYPLAEMAVIDKGELEPFKTMLEEAGLNVTIDH